MASEPKPLPPWLREPDYSRVEILAAEATAAVATVEASAVKPAKKEKEAGDGGSSTLRMGWTFCLAVVVAIAGSICWALRPGAVLDAVIFDVSPDPTWQARGDLLTFVAVGIGVVGVLDLVIAGRFKGRYFALHTLVNALVIALSARDTLDFFLLPNPLDTVSCIGGRSACASKGPVALTASLHFWHMLAYELKPIDWIHHLPALIFCFVGIYLPFGPIINYSLLAAFMGVPGCIDYAMLTLVKQGKLAARVEKDLNQSLNVWVRCPCAVVAGYLQLLDPLLHPEAHLNVAHRIVVILSGVHAIWNGCFFMYRTVDARTRFVLASPKAATAKAAPEAVPGGTPTSPPPAKSGSGLAYHPMTGVAMAAAPAVPMV